MEWTYFTTATLSDRVVLSQKQSTVVKLTRNPTVFKCSSLFLCAVFLFPILTVKQWLRQRTSLTENDFTTITFIFAATKAFQTKYLRQNHQRYILKTKLHTFSMKFIYYHLKNLMRMSHMWSNREGLGQVMRVETRKGPGGGTFVPFFPKGPFYILSTPQ